MSDDLFPADKPATKAGIGPLWWLLLACLIALAAGMLTALGVATVYWWLWALDSKSVRPALNWTGLAVLLAVPLYSWSFFVKRRLHD